MAPGFSSEERDDGRSRAPFTRVRKGSVVLCGCCRFSAFIAVAPVAVTTGVPPPDGEEAYLDFGQKLVFDIIL